jgi:hypothetical protein
MIKYNTRLNVPEEHYLTPFTGEDSRVFTGEPLNQYIGVSSDKYNVIDRHLIVGNIYGSFTRKVHALSTRVGTMSSFHGTNIFLGFSGFWDTTFNYNDAMAFFTSGIDKPSNLATTFIDTEHGFVDPCDFNADFKRWYMARFSGTNSDTYWGTVRLMNTDKCRFYEAGGSYMDGTRTVGTWGFYGGTHGEDFISTYAATLIFSATRTGYPFVPAFIVLYGSLSGGPTNGYGYNAVATLTVPSFDVDFVDSGESIAATVILEF